MYVAVYVLVPAANIVAGAFQVNPLGNAISANTFPFTEDKFVGIVYFGVPCIIDQFTL